MGTGTLDLATLTHSVDWKWPFEMPSTNVFTGTPPFTVANCGPADDPYTVSFVDAEGNELPTDRISISGDTITYVSSETEDETVDVRMKIETHSPTRPRTKIYDVQIAITCPFTINALNVDDANE